MTAKGRILICDDKVEFSKGIKELLAIEGYDVVTRSTKAKSIQCLLDDQKRDVGDRFAVVIVDLDFRDEDGSRAGMKILGVARQDPLLESIVCTGRGAEELAVEAINLGVFGYVMKNRPNDDGGDLLQAVSRASALHNQCLSLIEVMERAAKAHPEISEINGLRPQFIDYIRRVRGRGR